MILDLAFAVKFSLFVVMKIDNVALKKCYTILLMKLIKRKRLCSKSWLGATLTGTENFRITLSFYLKVR